MMGKYEPLARFLSEQSAERVPMTFSEIEAIVGEPLPHSSRAHRAWWSNNPKNNVMTKAWLAAGYETADVDIASEKLLFLRVAEPLDSTPATASTGASGTTSRRTTFAAMKGLLTLSPDLDLTQPADPDWGANVNGR